MTRLLVINSVCGIRSTGRICADIAREYTDKGCDVRIAYGREPYVPESCRQWAVRIGGKFELFLHALLVRLWGDQGFGAFRSTFATRRFLKWAEEWNPDELWLHNLHGYYLNLPLLFNWIKSRPHMKVKWTLHDCWAFTGGCGHFTFCACEQWKVECHRCPRECNNQRNGIISHFARTVYRAKRSSFLGVSDMTLITPSKWLADLVRQSFLSVYPVEVVNNRIDTEIFRPTASNVRERLGLSDRKIVLGVAAQWTSRKGYEDFLELRKRLQEEYVIVLIGLTQNQISSLPPGIVGIEKTNDPRELAEIYSAANVFFNPTKEENYPTVNLEARACGCPIVTYDTGGCAETVGGYNKAVVLRGSLKTADGAAAAIKEIA